jgi:hypothetical protein
MAGQEKERMRVTGEAPKEAGARGAEGSGVGGETTEVVIVEVMGSGEFELSSKYDGLELEEPMRFKGRKVESQVSEGVSGEGGGGRVSDGVVELERGE